MWGMKATTIPVVIGALGFIKQGMDKYIQKIPGGMRTQELPRPKDGLGSYDLSLHEVKGN